MIRKTVFLTCGPSQLFPRVARYIDDAVVNNVPSVSHRNPLFQKWYEQAANGIKLILGVPQDFSVFFLSSSLESMERILQNTVLSRSFHVVNGAFSKKWYEMAAQLGKKPSALDIQDGQGMTAQTKISPPVETELVCVTHNETSTGVMQSLVPAYRYKEQHPGCLLAVDVVSSLPFAALDYSLVDCAFCSVQKGFGLPAGLSILLVSPRTLEKSTALVQKKIPVGSYHSFSQLAKKGSQFQTVETPNVLAIYLLSRVVADLLTKGAKTVRTETRNKAEIVYDAATRLGSCGITPFIKDPALRSPTTIALACPGKSQKIRDRLSKKGYVVSAGYSQYKKDHIRIANLPQHTLGQMRAFVRELGTGCRAI